MDLSVGRNGDGVVHSDAAQVFAGAADANEIAFLRNWRIRNQIGQAPMAISEDPGFCAEFGMYFHDSGRSDCYS